MINDGWGLRVYPWYITLKEVWDHCLSFAFLLGWVFTPGRDPSWRGYIAIVYGSQPSQWKHRAIPAAAQVGQDSELLWVERLPGPCGPISKGKGFQTHGSWLLWGLGSEKLCRGGAVNLLPPWSLSSPFTWILKSQVPQGIIPDPIPPPPLLQQQQLCTMFSLSVPLRSFEEIRCWSHRDRADCTADEPKRHHLRKAQFCAPVDISSISGWEKANSAESRAVAPNHP